MRTIRWTPRHDTMMPTFFLRTQDGTTVPIGSRVVPTPFGPMVIACPGIVFN